MTLAHSSSPPRGVRIQAEEHPLVAAEEPTSLTEHCLALIHRKAYEAAATLAAGRTVLDLGCNHGYGTELIGRHAASVVGLDVSPRALAEARRRHPDLDFRLYEGGTLPFPDARFDLVTSFQVIEHVVEVRDYLEEIGRVLKPDGIALFTTPNAAIRLDPGMRPWNRFHVREYTAVELAEALSPAFSKVVVYGLFGSPDLQAAELERCRKVREIQRVRTGGVMPGSTIGLRSALIGTALRWAPPTAIDRLAGLVRRLRRTLPRDRRFVGRHSTADLAYRSDRLGEALDLLAVCARDGSPPSFLGDPT
jgi:SAM-dependent methyltransferase